MLTFAVSYSGYGQEKDQITSRNKDNIEVEMVFQIKPSKDMLQKAGDSQDAPAERVPQKHSKSISETSASTTFDNPKGGDVEITETLNEQKQSSFGRVTIEEFNKWIEQNDPKIVGGTAVPITAYPWQVLLSVGQYMCGGTIISENYILTAAHCTDGLTAGDVTVYAGSATAWSGTTRTVAEIKQHTGFNGTTMVNDMSLLRLSTPYDLSGSTMKAIPIITALHASTGYIDVGEIATVSGWGTTSSGGSTSNTLLAVSVPITTTSSYPAGDITADMLLAGQTGKDACQGDSGGPLVVVDPGSPVGYSLAGVVSWGIGCGDAGYPGVYARVPYFQAWLETNTGLTWPGPCTPGVPVANFSASATNVFAGTEITFSDISTGCSESLMWNFGSNAFPQTSTARSPKVIWVTSGTYSVSLTVTNSYGEDTETKTNYINVQSYPNPPASNPVTIGTGTTTSAVFPLGQNSQSATAAKYVRSSSIFTAAQIGGGGTILSLEWYANTARADARSVKIYLKHITATTQTSTTVDNIISDATLVFDGSKTFNAVGWHKIDITTPFTYNGTDNLMVITMSEHSLTNTNRSSDWRYTATTGNTHQQWNGNTAPTGNGTLNTNRPNIRITFAVPPVAPVADFGVPFFSDGFENYADFSLTFAPWTQVDVDGSGTYGIQNVTFPNSGYTGSFIIFNQSQTTPPAGGNWTARTGDKAAACFAAVTFPNDDWLITPQLSLGNSSSLSFWAKSVTDAYGLERLSVWVSTTDNQTSSFTKISADTYITVPITWTNYTYDLAAYNNQAIYIAIRCVSSDAFALLVDDFEVNSTGGSSGITVNEGESVTLYDKSTNNPIVWQWQVEDATPSQSYSQNPTVSYGYNTAGQKDVTLVAGNAGGTDAETKANYITVVGRPPVADFWAEGNLMEFGTYSPFIPAGGSVSYTDYSTIFPQSWSWSFEGGTPSTSTNRNPVIQYSTEGLYDVSLTVTNIHGNNTLPVEDYVVVGGTAVVSNELPSDSYSVWTTGTANSYITGHNEYGDKSFANFYNNQGTGEISSVYFAMYRALGTGKAARVTVWDGSTGVPGTVIGYKDVLVTDFTPYSGGIQFTQITFDSPIVVGGPFFVGFEINYDASHDFTTHSLVVIHTAERSENFAWDQWSTGEWSSMADDWGANISLMIYPEFTYTNATILTIAANPSYGGTVTNNTSGTLVTAYSPGASVSVTATPNTYYRFLGWTVNSNLVSSSLTFNYTMPSQSVALIANFEEICQVPGYEQYFTDMTALPVKWVSAGTPAWAVGTVTNGITGHGNYAYANYSGTAEQASAMFSECFDFRDYTDIQLSHFHRFYLATAGQGQAQVQYSIDGGNSWTTINTWTVTMAAGASWTSPIIPALAGQPYVMFRWLFYAASHATPTKVKTWSVDDIKVLGTLNVATPGDINDDGNINILDIVLLVNLINTEPPVNVNDWPAADFNEDGFINISDLTALISHIMTGVKDEHMDINTETPYIYLDEQGLISLTSDGTLTALQFGFTPANEEMALSLLLDTDHIISFNKATGKGVIYSMSNTPIPAGEIGIMQVEDVELNSLRWGSVIASNINHQSVEVNASTYAATSVSEISDDFKVLVFPNPNSGTFTTRIYLPFDSQVELQLLDVVGRIISQSPLSLRTQGEHVIEFNAAQRLSAGVYVLKVNAYDKHGKALTTKHEEKLLIINQ